MNNYEYIIASLPAITSDWKFSDKGPDAYMDEIRSLCSAKDRSVLDFLCSGFEDANLDTGFYLKAASHPDRFIREYFLFDMNVRNAKVKYLNRELGRPADKDVMNLPGGEFPQEGELDAILAGKDILERERAVDDLTWRKINEITVFDYFNIDAVLAFVAKLRIVDRWYRLDDKTGREKFRKLVDEVRGTFKGVEFKDN